MSIWRVGRAHASPNLGMYYAPLHADSCSHGCLRFQYFLRSNWLTMSTLNLKRIANYLILTAQGIVIVMLLYQDG